MSSSRWSYSDLGGTILADLELSFTILILFGLARNYSFDYLEFPFIFLTLARTMRNYSLTILNSLLSFLLWQVLCGTILWRSWILFYHSYSVQICAELFFDNLEFSFIFLTLCRFVRTCPGTFLGWTFLFSHLKFVI